MTKAFQPHGPETEYIDVEPTSLEELHVGIFSTEAQIPEYQFNCTPDIPDIIEIQRTTIETHNGEFIAVYHIQNYGTETVRVFPRRKSARRTDC